MASLPGHSTPDTSLKNELSKRSERPTSTTVKCTREKRESVFIRPGKAAGQCLIEVQLFPQTSWTPVKPWKKTLLNNLLCISGGWRENWKTVDLSLSS